MYKIAVTTIDDKIAYYIYNGSSWKFLTLHKSKSITKILFLKGIKLVNHEAIIDKDVYDLLYTYRMRMKWE